MAILKHIIHTENLINFCVVKRENDKKKLYEAVASAASSNETRTSKMMIIISADAWDIPMSSSILLCI